MGKTPVFLSERVLRIALICYLTMTNSQRIWQESRASRHVSLTFKVAALFDSRDHA